MFDYLRCKWKKLITLIGSCVHSHHTHANEQDIGVDY